MLVRAGERWVIGVNSLDAPARQRFTIAHELGHMLLHGKQQDMFIDRSHAVVFRRAGKSDQSERREIEANGFAAEILMPRDFLLADWENEKNIDGFDAEALIAKLARRYQVSSQAMTIRLTVLGLGRILGVEATR